MRIARFAHPTGLAWGIVEGQVGAGPEALTVAGIEGHPFAAITFSGQRWALEDVRLLPPVLPSKVIAVGRNYAAHAAELGNDVPAEPLIFMKPSTSVIGPGHVISLPADSERVDFEGELAVVIGQPAKDVPAERAGEVILGFTVANDVTARDLQKSDGQWTRAKGYDSFCPLGPWIETVVDPTDLRLTTTVNGAIKQDGRTADIVHKIPYLIAYISRVMTLLPGDVILTGTPEGVGPIVDGDTVSVAIEGIGVLTNPVQAKP